MEADGRWIISEVTELLATATKSGLRRATGEQLPWREHVRLQHSTIHVLRAMAERAPHNAQVGGVLSAAERQLQQLHAPDDCGPDFGRTP